MYITIYIEYKLLSCIKELKKLYLLSTKCYSPLYSSTLQKPIPVLSIYFQNEHY